MSNTATGVIKQGLPSHLLRLIEQAGVVGDSEKILDLLSESVLAPGRREIRIERQSPLHHPPPLPKIIPGPDPAELQPSLVILVRLSIAGQTIAVAEPWPGRRRQLGPLVETQP